MAIFLLIYIFILASNSLFSNELKGDWSFTPLRESIAPNSPAKWRPSNPIDHFVHSKLEALGMSPSPRADKTTLLRRAYAKLIGLPPTLSQRELFFQNKSSNAYDELIDSLLNSKHFGEKWASHWLDVVRYGESDGILAVSEDKVRQDAWKYRDAVIRAFNQNLPFDIFIQYHLIDENDESPIEFSELNQFIHLGTRLQNNANPNDKQFHRLDDMISTTGSGFLAYSIGCARCHDHPTDPFTSLEYYQLSAVFFDQVNEEPKASKKFVPIEIKEPRLLKKGSWQSPGEKVKPGYLRKWTKSHSLNKNTKPHSPLKGLGLWLTDEVNGAGHQMARVMVNRLWHHYFGQGIVATPNDFGELGNRPSHPELLDWLAGELIKNDWNLKHIHKLIVTSSTFKQSSYYRPDMHRVDAENVWLWHYKPQRLEAELIRDFFIHVSGNMNLSSFGPSIPIGNYQNRSQDSPETWRRSIYLQAHRTAQHSTLCLFDLPSKERSIGARTTSATNESALFSLNSRLSWDVAHKLAHRIIKKSKSQDAKDWINQVYLLVLSRQPTVQELEIGLEYINIDSTMSFVKYCHLILGLNEFIYIN